MSDPELRSKRVELGGLPAFGVLLGISTAYGRKENELKIYCAFWREYLGLNPHGAIQQGRKKGRGIKRVFLSMK